MTRSGIILVAGLMLACSNPAGAQQNAPFFSRWQADSLPELTDDTVSSPKADYRYEGLAFGGLVFGALGGWLGSRDFGACPLDPGSGCQDDNNHLVEGITLGLAGAALGGGLGYLVGRFSPKKGRPDSSFHRETRLPTVPDSVWVVKGYQHWRGATLGLAIGAGLGTMLGTLAPLSCDDCSQQWSRGRAMWTIGLLGAGTGGVIGFLAGLSSPKYVSVSADDPPR